MSSTTSTAMLTRFGITQTTTRFVENTLILAPIPAHHSLVAVELTTPYTIRVLHLHMEHQAIHLKIISERMPPLGPATRISARIPIHAEQWRVTIHGLATSSSPRSMVSTHIPTRKAQAARCTI